MSEVLAIPETETLETSQVLLVPETHTFEMSSGSGDPEAVMCCERTMSGSRKQRREGGAPDTLAHAWKPEQKATNATTPEQKVTNVL